MQLNPLRSRLLPSMVFMPCTALLQITCRYGCSRVPGMVMFMPVLMHHDGVTRAAEGASLAGRAACPHSCMRFQGVSRNVTVVRSGLRCTQDKASPSEGAEPRRPRQDPAASQQALAQWFFSHWTGLLGRQRLCADLGSHSCEAGRIPSPQPADVRSPPEQLPPLQHPAGLLAHEEPAAKRAKRVHAPVHLLQADASLAVPLANGHAQGHREEPHETAVLPAQPALQVTLLDA